MSAKALSDDGRFTVEPAFKPARRFDVRHASSVTRDGWTLTDTWGAASYRCETQRDAKARIARTLEDQERVRWESVAGWSAWFGGIGIGLLELYGVDADGRRVCLLGLVGRSAGDEDVGTRANIAAYLEHLGHGGLPESPWS